MKYSRILHEFFTTPWAIMPEKLHAMTALLLLRAGGDFLSREEIAARVGDRKEPAGGQSGSVAVLPVFGVISQRMDMLGEISGGVSTERLGKQLATLANDGSVGSIVLNIDSPGGSVYGLQELAVQIRQAREKKPVVAIANSLAASAAYWIGASSSEFYVTPGGEAGSIGVYTAHQDMSEALEKEGVKVTLISAGEHKTEGNPYEPLDDEAKAAIQARVDDYYQAFVGDVASGRGVSVATVEKDFGQGRVFGAEEAVSRGMADGVKTLDEVISDMQGKAEPSRRRANRLALAEKI